MNALHRYDRHTHGGDLPALASECQIIPAVDAPDIVPWNAANICGPLGPLGRLILEVISSCGHRQRNGYHRYRETAQNHSSLAPAVLESLTSKVTPEPSLRLPSTNGQPKWASWSLVLGIAFAVLSIGLESSEGFGNCGVPLVSNAHWGSNRDKDARF